MSEHRRTFLKLFGLGILGASARPAVEALAKDTQRYMQNDTALLGRRWAMVVDPNKCPEGCTDCIKACHTTHNVPDLENPRHTIKWIWTEQFAHAFPGQENEYVPEAYHHRQFLVFCNHCAEPPCVRVCPTKATFKRADGIVMMDMHRCIGCRFCMAGCPYGSRSFNYVDPRKYAEKNPEFPFNPEFPTRMKGVVEKCTFCAERLAVGQPPACVEVCKYKALTFGDLEDPNSEVRRLLSTHYTIRRKPELGTNPSVFYIV